MKKMKLITKFFITVIITTIITSILVITTIAVVLTNQATKHKCNWKECPADMNYEVFTDKWRIQIMHFEDPEKTYEECDSLLFVNSKDTTID
jgi:hypothetical protein